MNSIDICLNCTAKKCIGTCKRIRKASPAKAEPGKELTINGETHTLGEWAKITGLNYKTIATRIYRGKTGAEIIKPKRAWKGSADNGKLQTNS